MSLLARTSADAHLCLRVPAFDWTSALWFPADGSCGMRSGRGGTSKFCKKHSSSMQVSDHTATAPRICPVVRSLIGLSDVSRSCGLPDAERRPAGCVHASHRHSSPLHAVGCAFLGDTMPLPLRIRVGFATGAAHVRVSPSSSLRESDPTPALPPNCCRCVSSLLSRLLRVLCVPRLSSSLLPLRSSNGLLVTS
jgi:hypothetical protein